MREKKKTEKRGQMPRILKNHLMKVELLLNQYVTK